MKNQELIVRDFMTDQELSVHDFTATPDITILSSATLEQAHDLMLKRGIHRLPVVDETDQLVGLITLSDIERLASFSDNPILEHVQY